jgi:uncharacterized protein (TIGR02598 family)
MNTPHPNRRWPAAGGFNLIEVVVALAVTSVGIISILGLLPFGLTSARTAGDRTVAAMIAQDSISGMRGGAYADVDTVAASVNADPYYDQSGFAVSASDPTRYFVVTATVTPRSIAFLKAIRVDVAWPALASDANRERLVFVTDIANRDN